MERPNVILMICHDLGQHLGCYGVETVNSPNLDGFAATAVRFENNFCTAPQCSPSRSSMMTGRYPHSNGIMGLSHSEFAWEYNDREKHLSRHFAEAGYRSMLIGHQHVTKHPETIGFAEVDPGGTALEVGDKASAIIEGHGGDAPLYMQVGFFEPHRPWGWQGCKPDDSKGVYIPKYLPEIPEAVEEFAEIQGMIRRLDEGVGKVIAALDGSPMADDTIIMFTVDHGIAMPRAKCSLYDPGVKTSFILRVPGVEPQVRDELVSNVDVAPTLLELAGLPPVEDCHGVSLVPNISGEEFIPRDEVFTEMTYHTSYHPMRSVRTTRWKLIRNFAHHKSVDVPTDIQAGPIWGRLARDFIGHKPYVELYDLVADPWEQKNVAKDNSDVVDDLDGRLLRWMRDTGDPLLEGPVASPYYRESIRQLFETAGEGC